MLQDRVYLSEAKSSGVESSHGQTIHQAPIRRTTWSKPLEDLPGGTMFGLGWLVKGKHFENFFIFTLLTLVATTLVFAIATLKPSISVFRVAVITLGTTLIFSVLVCLLFGYGRRHQSKSVRHQPLTQNDQDEVCVQANHQSSIVTITH